MTIIEHVFGVLAMLYCACVPLGILAVAACMVSSANSQQEERSKNGTETRKRKN